MDFDEVIDRRGQGTAKWDMMQEIFGVPEEDGIAMWVADGDFRAPDFLQDAVRAQMDIAQYGYFSGRNTHLDATAWWMKTRHRWDADSDHMFTTFGLGNAIAMILQCFSDPGDHVAIFTPVYHEFRNKIERNRRVVTELPLATVDGIYRMDFAAYDALMTGREKIMLISSPHNPAGRVWTQDELNEMAAFCERHDLILISDEIHQDLVFAGHKHLPMPVAAPDFADRVIVTTAASKTFSIAGLRTGVVTIPGASLREKFADYYKQFDIAPNLFGAALTTAAYSPAGAEWVDALNIYLEDNARLFIAGINAIPGVTAMPMQGTYLAWVDFAGTGMGRDEFSDRIYKRAKIAVTPGHTLGTGGETFMRFNIATRRGLVAEAVARMTEAFGDLQ